jgi:vesicle-fusing ATPase
LIITTSSLRPVLTEIGLSEVFDSELRVPPIADLQSLEYVLRQVELFSSDEELEYALQMLSDAGFADQSERTSSRLHIGIKKLLSVIEMARQEPDNITLRLKNALTGMGM